VCFLANVGQEEPWDEVEKKALKIGAEKMVRVTIFHIPSTS
jgi:argininosuccinate synthase